RSGGGHWPGSRTVDECWSRFSLLLIAQDDFGCLERFGIGACPEERARTVPGDAYHFAVGRVGDRNQGGGIDYRGALVDSKLQPIAAAEQESGDAVFRPRQGAVTGRVLIGERLAIIVDEGQA